MATETKLEAQAFPQPGFNQSEMLKYFTGSPFLGSFDDMDAREMLESMAEFRDERMRRYLVIPEAVRIYSELAAGREWAVSGEPRTVLKALDWFNSARTVDTSTGFYEEGFQQFLMRRAVDNVILGRRAFCINEEGGLEYLDPALLKWRRTGKNNKKVVKPTETVWYYPYQREFKMSQVYIEHAQPTGTNSFMPPILPVIPMAALVRLLNDHDSAALDGRKIREIILVANPTMRNAITTALLQLVALAAGEDPTRIGIPVIELTNTTGVPLKDLIATLGLSKIPENFSREHLWEVFVNQLAGALGLALRQFWNNEKTTNRALEQVQEQRQQNKGPAFLTRSEQRLFNRPGLIEQFGKGVRRVRFGFIEEVDTATMLAKAQVLYQTTRSLKEVAAVFTASIELESYLAWMQAWGALPNDLKLIQGKVNAPVVETSDQTHSNVDGSVTAESDPQPIALEEEKPGKKPAKSIPALEYDEITMTGDYKIVDRRRKIFSLSSYLSQSITPPAPPALTDEDAFSKAVSSYDMTVNQAFRMLWQERDDVLFAEWEAGQPDHDQVFTNEAFSKCIQQNDLSEKEQDLVESYVLFMKERAEHAETPAA